MDEIEDRNKKTGRKLLSEEYENTKSGLDRPCQKEYTCCNYYGFSGCNCWDITFNEFLQLATNNRQYINHHCNDKNYNNSNDIVIRNDFNSNNKKLDGGKQMKFKTRIKQFINVLKKIIRETIPLIQIVLIILMLIVIWAMFTGKFPPWS
jgi:hypothetical protein